MNFKKSLKSVATFVLGAGMALNSMFAAPRITAGGITKEFYDQLCADYQDEPLLLSAILLAIYMTKTTDDYKLSQKELTRAYQEEKNRYKQEKAELLAETQEKTNAKILERLKTRLQQATDSADQLREALGKSDVLGSQLKNCLDATTALEEALQEGFGQLQGQFKKLDEDSTSPLKTALEKAELIHDLRLDLIQGQSEIAERLSNYQFQGRKNSFDYIDEQLKSLKSLLQENAEEVKAYHGNIVEIALAHMKPNEEVGQYCKLIAEYIEGKAQNCKDELIKKLGNYTEETANPQGQSGNN